MYDIRFSQEGRPPAERDVTMPLGVPELTLGWHAIKWASKYLKQPDGDKAGERWQFTESQVRFILWWYSLDEEARWVFTRGVRRLPKGSGKSPFAAVMSLIELLAPVRFDGWDEKEPGGCRGKRVGMPLVQIGATAESQASINTMRMIRALVPRTSRLFRDYGIEAGKTLIHVPGGGQLSLITNSAAAAEGALTTFAILDQTESFTKENGGVDLAKVVDRNTGKSKSRLVETSNAWAPGRESTAEQTFRAWEAEQEGRLRGRSRTLMDVRTAPMDMDFDDIDGLIAGIAYAYGDCHWADPRDIVENHILDPLTPLDDSKRFYCNWPTAANDAWCELRKWSRLGDPEYRLDPDDGDEVALFFDGSRTRDASALIACHIRTGYTFTIGIWETEQGSKHRPNPAPIPVDEVDAAVEAAFDKWDVWAFFSDVREWESFAKITWPERYGDIVRVWAVPGGRDPQSIAWDMRTHTGEFTGACEMVAQEISDGSFVHDADSTLSRHVTNARRAPNRWGVSISKETRDSPRKIDGCVAMIGARHARRLVISSDDWKDLASGPAKKAKKVWSFS